MGIKWRSIDIGTTLIVVGFGAGFVLVNEASRKRATDDALHMAQIELKLSDIRRHQRQTYLCVKDSDKDANLRDILLECYELAARNP